MASTNDLKNGLVLNLDGQLWSVVEFQHVKPGKGRAFVRTKLKTVLSGKVVDKTFNAGTKVDTATVDKRDMQYLYKDGSDFIFMDSTTYDQIPVAEVTVGDAAHFLLENQTATVAMHEGAPLYVELPTASISRSPRPTPACRATGPPAAPSPRRWRPATTSRCRCSWTTGEKVKVDTRVGRLPRPSQLTPDARSHQGPQAGGRPALRGRATRPGPARARWPSGWRQADPPVPQYTVELVAGVVAHRERLDELIATYTESWTLERMPVGRPRGAAARALRAALRR